MHWRGFTRVAIRHAHELSDDHDHREYDHMHVASHRSQPSDRGPLNLPSDIYDRCPLRLDYHMTILETATPNAQA
jgi:hypothetical protein